MPRYRFIPRLDSLEPRTSLSGLTGTDIPTDPVDAPPPPPGGNNPIIIAPTPPVDPSAPVLV